MFAIVKDNTVLKLIENGTAFELNGINYPSTWIELADQNELDRLGVKTVTYDVKPHEEFFWVTQNAPIYVDGAVRVTYTKTDKDINQLKKNLVNKVNQSAYDLLKATDWMRVKELETGTAMADDWKTWRQTIRTSAAERVTAINACETADELVELQAIVWAKDPNQA